MIISSACLNLVSDFEGCKLESYQDQGGVWTIGFGHTLNVSDGMTCSIDEARTWLTDELNEHCNQVARLIKVPLKQPQIDALTSLCYNIGAGNIARSTLLKFLNSGDYVGAAKEFLAWDKIAGIENAGLARRRKAEHDLFVS